MQPLARRLACALACLVLGCSLAAVGPAWAITPKITEFSTGLNPGANTNIGIAAGPDGNLWFADRGSPTAIGRITPAGTIHEFSTGLNTGSNPVVIARGADGNLWFTDDGTTRAIGRITTGGTIHEFDQTNGLNAGSSPFYIAGGPDGNLWFTDTGTTKAIGRITPAGAIHEFTTGLAAGAFPGGITAGPDGNLWFTDQGSPTAIGRITPAGAIHEFGPAGGNPYGIAKGLDGNLWFSDSTCAPGQAIGRVTPAGAIHLFTAGFNAGSCPYFIAAGADGSLWFTDEGTTPAIGRITPAGQVQEFSLNPNSLPYGIAPGPDGNIWFTDTGTTQAIGRITLPPGAVTGGASGIGARSAALTGSVSPRAQATTYRFQYGTTTAYGAQTSPVSAGASAASVAASAAISGLAPGTLYHYRLTATNSTGTTAGADRTLRTPAPPAKASFAGTKSSIRVDRKGRFRFSFHATPGLTGKAVFKSIKRIRVRRKSRKRRRVTLARKSFTVPASGRVRLRIKLSRKNLRILKLDHRIRTRVTVTLRNSFGLTSKASKRITLKAPKRRRR